MLIRMQHICRILAFGIMTVGIVPLLAGYSNLYAKEVGRGLSKRFPICDEFLTVNWISPERRLGTTHYELTAANGLRRSVEAVVYLDRRYPRIDYGALTSESGSIVDKDAIQKMVEGTQAKDAEEFLSDKDKVILRSWDLQTGERGDAIRFTRGTSSLLLQVDSWMGGESLSGGAKNVCVVYPDRDLAWIVEARTADATYGENEINEHYRSVISFTPPRSGILSMAAFKRTAVIDVNRDGDDDYPEIGMFSYGKKYHALIRMSQSESDLDNYGKFQFEGNGKVCEQDPPDAFFLITDGYSIFLNGTCNLTKITRKE